MGQTTQETIRELHQDIGKLMQIEVEVLGSTERLIGRWNSMLLDLPEREDGSFEFCEDQTVIRKRALTRLDLTLYYRLAIPGVLVFHLHAKDMLGEWEHSPCYEVLFAFLAADGRIALSNGDTSVCHILSSDC